MGTWQRKCVASHWGRSSLARVALSALKACAVGGILLLHPSNSQALTEEQLTFVRQSAIELCRGGTLEGEASTYRVEGSADAAVIVIKQLVELGVDAEVELSGEQWEGIKAVVPDEWDAEAWNECVIPVLNLFAEELSENEFSLDGAVEAMEWVRSRCGEGVSPVISTSPGSDTDVAARSFFVALAESGTKPIGRVINMPGAFSRNGRFSAEKFDAWVRSQSHKEGCLLAVVPDYVSERFPKPHFNLIFGDKAYSVVLPRGTLSEVTERWELIFRKAEADPDFVREIKSNPFGVMAVLDAAD